MNYKNLIFYLIILLIIQSCNSNNSQRQIEQYSFKDFPNILNIKNIPKQAIDGEAGCFFDKGSWIGFALPPDSSLDYCGTFPGPFLMTHWRWLSPGLAKLVLYDLDTKQQINLLDNGTVESFYYPGRLVQQILADEILVKLELCFASNRTALIKSEISNKGSQSRNLQIEWQGNVILEGSSIENQENGILIKLDDDEMTLNISFENMADESATISKDKKSYHVEFLPFVLESGNTFQTYLTQSMFADDEEKKFENNVISNILKNPDQVYEKNEVRWNGYLNSILNTNSIWAKNKSYQKIAVKSLLTLINNWKSPLGALYHDGLIPSYNIHYFYGFWAWDSWKHAVALARFDVELAKNQVRAMFDYQNKYGMIADCIYADSTENNWRDTKPPLAAWAVWEIYNQNKDISFLEEMYPKLKKYHHWWYKERDVNKNGLCEYGSTDGTVIAARWESGMDNAVRFDDVQMMQTNDHAWSMDQESVDLNSYLYKEKLILADIAEVLKIFDDVKNYKTDAEKIKQKVRDKMYDGDDGYFYDIKIPTGDFVKIQGPEGWTPLWCELATKKQAAAVSKVMTDTARFATFIPFPTVSKQHPQFSKGYWRGPVWLDQVYFAIKGLQNYGFEKESQNFTKQIFDRPEGLKDSDLPIYENYNPITGEAMRVKHFSWSAAHLMLLFLDE